jgi:hypothetical protein
MGFYWSGPLRRKGLISTTYTLVSAVDANGALFALHMLEKGVAPPPLAGAVDHYAEVDVAAAPDPVSAYVVAIVSMCAPGQALQFWDRVSRIPRIRVAALRRFGFRGLGAVMSVPSGLMYSSEGYRVGYSQGG